MAELIQREDSLNTGREKLNKAIKASERAKSKSDYAVDTAETALSNSKSTQTQLDTIVIDGDSSVEAAQARVDSEGNAYSTLKERLDEKETEFSTQLAQSSEKTANVDASIRRGFYEGAVVAFTSDDGQITDYTKFKPIFESEGVPCNISLVTSLVGSPGYLSWEQAKELKSLGWSVASHTHTHDRPSNMTEEEINEDYRIASELLKKHGLDYDIIVYPFGDTPVEVYKAARNHYKMGVNIIRTNVSNKTPFIDNYNIFRQEGLSQPQATGTSLEDCKAHVDNAIANNELLVFEDHSHYDIWTESKLDELRELIQYIKSKGVPIVNLQEAFNMKCNVIQTGVNKEGFRVFRDGTSVNLFEDYTINNDTPLTYFPFGTTNVFMSNAQAAGKGFPTGVGGTLTTSRTVNSVYVNDGDLSGLQVFRPYNQAVFYTRVWISQAGNRLWGEWVKNDARRFHTISNSLNEYSASNLISDFPADSITTFSFNSANSEGFPENAGLVTTYKVRFGNSWNRQICFGHNNHNVWTRYVESDGSWSKWISLQTYFVNDRLNVYVASTPITDFPDGVTTFQVNTALAEGMPNNQAGTITTYKIHNEYGYWRQEYRRYRGHEVWSRLVKSDLSWDEWVKISAV